MTAVSNRRTEFLRFALVGAAGFLVDAGVLLGCLELGFGFYFGRVISFLTAASATWAMNRQFTFQQQPSARGLASQWSRYLASVALGGLINYLVYVLCVSQLALFADHPVLAVGLGALAGLGLNFYLSRRYVFHP